jgi:type I restriction enzyme M protein
MRADLLPATDDTPPEDDESLAILEEGQLYDFITNEPVPDTPLENTLQAVARSLVEEYGFEHSHLRRDRTLGYESEVDGKMRKVRRNLNIVVYDEDADVDADEADQIIRVCLIQPPNTKATDPKRGTDLLEEVMGALPACDYGLWTNGTDLVFKRKITGGGRIQPDYDDLYDLPGYDETAKDLDDPDRQAGRIATGDNLRQTLRRVHDYIYGNQGLKKDAAFWQVLNLIFCKIHDEHSTGTRRFWVKGTERNTPQGQAAIAKRIKSLFEEVKKDEEYASVFSVRDTIELNDRVLAYVVGELSRYNFLDTDIDVKGAAYEEITSSMLKEQRGQFFTPANAMRLMVRMMDPGGDKDLTDSNNWPRVLDPACGPARFCTYSLDHFRRKLADQLFPNVHPLLRLEHLDKSRHAKIVRQYAEKCLFGIDFDPDLKRAARMNMIINNDGHGNILSFNSLEFPGMLEGASATQLKRQYSSIPKPDWPDPARAAVEASLGSIDFVFTNPPFGVKIRVDDPHILRQFELAHRWHKDDERRWVKDPELQSNMPPEVLFVERCVQWARPGTGQIAIVVPDSILGNPDYEYIRAWILTNCEVIASIDLPVEMFLPQVGVQASLLFLRRKSQSEIDAEKSSQPRDYTVFMAVAEKVGKDRRGNPLYVRDADGAETTFTKTYDVLVRRKKVSQPVTVTRREKELDDDLPRIAEAYERYLKSTL